MSEEQAIRKFNPGTFQSDAQIVKQFVVRQHELASTLSVLRDNIGARSCQHVLVVAPRGRGKTMLLARVAAELRMEPEYSRKLLPVRFMEESYEVFDMADFWLDALHYLSKECASHAPELALELEGVHESLAGEWQDPRLHDRARAAVLNAADRLDRQLVLMVENLQDLCSQTAKGFGWELRESLQMEPKIILLGTATSRFRALDDAREPFFELFYTVALEPLGTAECGRLWQAVTEEPILPHQIRPLEILTGGSPRLLVIVADFARHHSFRRLLEELVTLIDDHTEYFRSHLNALPRTERRVYLASIGLWRPSSTSEIAARARLGMRITSTMLGRLTERGALSVEGNGKTRRYAAAERLFCIYYKLRRERDEAAVVQNLIRFMTIYYRDQRSAVKLRRALADEVRNSPNVLAGLVRALKGDSRVGLLVPEAAVFAYDKMIDDHPEVSAPGGQGSAASIQMNRVATLFHAGREDDAHVAHEELIREFGESNVPEVRGVVANATFNLGLAMHKKGDLEAAIKAYDEVLERCGSLRALLQRDGAAISSMAETVVQALSNKANALGQRGAMDSAMAIHDQLARHILAAGVPELRAHVARALVNKGSVQAKLELWSDAVETWKQADREFGNDTELATQVEVVRSLHRISASRLVRPEWSLESAIKIVDQVMERFGKHTDMEIRRAVAQSLEVKGSALDRLERMAEAFDVHRELETKFGDVVDPSGVSVRWSAIAAQTRILYQIEQTDRAQRSLRALCAATDPASDQNVVDMYFEVASYAASRLVSPSELADVLADAQKAATFQPLMVALRQLAGQAVRAPVEVMEVARDIRREVDRLRTVLGDVLAGVEAPVVLKQSLTREFPGVVGRARRLASTSTDL